MNANILNAQKSINTDAISLDGFIVKETLATGPLVHTHGPLVNKNNFTRAELRNIQRKSRKATGTLYNRYF